MHISRFYFTFFVFVALASDVRADWGRIECLKKCTNQSCRNPQTRSECDVNCPETVLNGCHAASEMPKVVPPARRALSRPSSQGSETPSLSSGTEGAGSIPFPKAEPSGEALDADNQPVSREGLGNKTNLHAMYLGQAGEGPEAQLPAEVSPPVESGKLLSGPPSPPARSGAQLRLQERVTHDVDGGALSEESQPVSRPETLPEVSEGASDGGAPKVPPRRDLPRRGRVRQGLGRIDTGTGDAARNVESPSLHRGESSSQHSSGSLSGSAGSDREMEEMIDGFSGEKLQGAAHQEDHSSGSAVSEPSRLGPPPVSPRRHSGSSSGRLPEREDSPEGTPKRQSLGSSQADSAAAAALMPDISGKPISVAERAEIEKRKRDEEAMSKLTPSELKQLHAEKFAQVLKHNEGQGTKVKDVKKKVEDSQYLYGLIKDRVELMLKSPRKDKSKLVQLQGNLELAHESLQKYMQSSGLSDPAIWANPESQIQHEPVFWSTVVGAIDNLNGSTCLEIKTEGEALAKLMGKKPKLMGNKRQAASIDPNIAVYSGQVGGICEELKLSGLPYAKKIALAKAINNLYGKFSR